MAKTAARTSTRRGEMNVYTALLVIAALVLGFGVPIEIALRLKDFAAMTEQLLGRFRRPILLVNAFMFG